MMMMIMMIAVLAASNHLLVYANWLCVSLFPVIIIKTATRLSAGFNHCTLVFV